MSNGVLLSQTELVISTIVIIAAILSPLYVLSTKLQDSQNEINLLHKQANDTLQLLSHDDQQMLALSPLLFSDTSIKNNILLNELINHTGNPIAMGQSHNNGIIFMTDAHFNDQGWGTQGYNASKLINATAIDAVPISSIQSRVIPEALTSPRFIIAQGFQWGDPILAISHSFPNIKFIVMTGTVSSSNVQSIYPEQQQGSFLLGALAGLMTKTNTIGFVGGETYPNIINIAEGYRAGAQYVNPNISVVTTYIHDFNNTTKGYNAAIRQINGGSDFEFHVADTSGQGVIKAAHDKGVYALGAVADQNHLSPNTVLSSFVVDMNKAYHNAITQPFVGIILHPGLERYANGPGPGIIYLAPFHSLDNKVPQQVKSKIQNITSDIISGRIKVPEVTTPSS